MPYIQHTTVLLCKLANTLSTTPSTMSICVGLRHTHTRSTKAQHTMYTKDLC